MKSVFRHPESFVVILPRSAQSFNSSEAVSRLWETEYTHLVFIVMLSASVCMVYQLKQVEVNVSASCQLEKAAAAANMEEKLSHISRTIWPPLCL